MAWQEKDKNIIKGFFIITTTIFVICVLSFVSLFFYLVSVHYPFAETQSVYNNGVEIQNAMPGWTEGEKTAFKTLFILGGIFGIIALFTGLEHNYLLETTSTLYGGVVDPELMELNEILYVDKKFYFPELKREIIKLKSNELGPHLKTSQTRLTQFIAELQNKVNNDLKVIIDLYLQAHAQMITQKKENDTFARSHLTNYENILLNHLTQGELETLRAQQKDTLALEQHFNYLNRKPYFLS